ncbi:hypothetical protein DM01DRAFT_301017 [Hesseltinella vesiculosa]|uniref:Uncharacterized protein n=1 Tax=Hesseltinella vesiculosa TaxID=101127 RepID=A0A1X2GGJ4_9FUNG|nr:hypothetical protein DM01DRAFT_301017 [Hesseltinella vesiculosa]
MKAYEFAKGSIFSQFLLLSILFLLDPIALLSHPLARSLAAMAAHFPAAAKTLLPHHLGPSRN